MTGNLENYWYTDGKLCQGPALNRKGLIFLGTTKDSAELGQRSIRAFKVIPIVDTTQDWTATYWTNGPGASGIFGNFLGAVLVRADSNGTTYVADANPDSDTGAVYRFTSGDASMPGDWPTLGSGNRRQHKARTYPYQLVELNAFPLGAPDQVGAYAVDVLGRVVGEAYGSPGYPGNSYPQGWYAAWWTSSTPSLIGSNPTAYTTARSVNLEETVVGYYYTYGPVVWPNGFAGGAGGYLPLPPGYSGGEARDIQNEGYIIGFAYQSGNPKVLRWDPIGNQAWSAEVIGAPFNGGKAEAYALSRDRRFCGRAVFSPGGPWRGFTSRPEATDFRVITPLNTFGGTSSAANDVHDTAGTVGWAHKVIAGANYARAFRVPPDVYELAAAHELPGFPGQTPTGTWQSYAHGLNGCAQVVGRAQNSSGAYRAFLWRPGWPHLQDLTARVGLSGWVLTHAAAISGRGPHYW